MIENVFRTATNEERMFLNVCSWTLSSRPIIVPRIPQTLILKESCITKFLFSLINTLNPIVSWITQNSIKVILTSLSCSENGSSYW